MRQDWLSYLRSIGFEQPLMERAEAAVKFCTTVVEINPTFLFVSEYQDRENRVYESICLCSEDAIGEAPVFSRTERLNYIRLRNRITHWQVRAKNFDWVSPHIGSRLNLEVWFGERSMLNLRASGNNCIRLVELLKSYIVPHAVRHSTGG